MYSIILLVAALILAFIYFKGKHNEAYWKERGVAFYDKNKVLGILWDFISSDKAMFETVRNLYLKYPNQPAVGIGSLSTPTLYVMDMQNVQYVLQTDFQSFSHRGININEGDILADNVFFMDGPRWKLMRQKMTPLFTSAKLKNMYYIMEKSAQDFVEHLKKNPRKLKGNGYDTMNEFCCAAIAAAVFGIGTGSTFDSPFLQVARDAVKIDWKRNMRFAIGSISDSVSKTLGLKIFKEQEPFFIPAVKQVLRAREKENIKRHDFADIAVSLQKAGTMKDSETGQELEPTDELLAAQAFFFFVAGVEPAATTMFGALVELGKKPVIQRKLQQEIDETIEKHDHITYDVISNMKYLDQIIHETLRMHPPAGFVNRECIQDSVLPVGNIRVSKGTKLIIPIYDLHFDPKYFPEPEEFDPDRFSPGNKKASEIAYLPFGRGGRNCIGMRYARLQVMAGLLHLLRHYNVVSHIDRNAKRKYVKGSFQVRRIDCDIELFPRNK